VPVWNAIESGLRDCASVLLAGYMSRCFVSGHIAVGMGEVIVMPWLRFLGGLVLKPWLVFGAGGNRVYVPEIFVPFLCELTSYLGQSPVGKVGRYSLSPTRQPYVHLDNWSSNQSNVG